MKSIFLLLITLFVNSILFAQAPPEAFNYSGAARDAQGNPISDKNVGLELSILKGSPIGAVQYRERYSVNTDKFGVFNCAVGKGSVQQGTFSAISWSNDSYFLRVGLDVNGGNNFVEIGTTQLLSVPYALYAKSAAPTAINAGSNFTVTGQGTPTNPYVISASSGGNGGYTGPPIFTPGNGVTDIDGNNYKTIILGTQEWMAENLKVTKYSNGNPIPNIANNAQWSGLTTGAWSNYNNNNANNAIYGKLYNWYAVTDTRNICPLGWHAPNEAEWITLFSFIDPYTNVDNPNFINGVERSNFYAGGMMKATGTLQTQDGLWQHPNFEASNGSGFSSLPVGERYSNGTFSPNGFEANWWIAQDYSPSINCWTIKVDIYEGGIRKNNSVVKTSGHPLRCVRD